MYVLLSIATLEAHSSFKVLFAWKNLPKVDDIKLFLVLSYLNKQVLSFLA